MTCSREARPHAADVGCDVVIPFHNLHEFVQQAIDGILAQSDATCYVHVINDASTLTTPSRRAAHAALKARCHSLPRFRWYENDRRLGPYRSLHRTVPQLQTELIAVQDADDISLPQRIQVSVNALEKSGADIFAAAAQTVSGTPLKRDQILRSRPPTGEGRALENCTMVMRRSLFCRLNGFADFFCGADTEFVLRAYYAKAKFEISDEVLVWKRIHAGSLTRAPGTGFAWSPDQGMTWVSAYRQAVWREVDRRVRLFRAGDCNLRRFGCLDHEARSTLGSVPQPDGHRVDE